MKRKTPFAHHALERVCERYGVRFTKKQKQAFGRMLTHPKYAIPLTRNRLACYFEGKWYLLVCTASRYTVQTFLRPEDANEDDKLILRHDERYLKINNDAFHVLSASPLKTTGLPPQRKGSGFAATRNQARKLQLPGLTEDELPHDEIQSAESMLNTFCDER
ncbi:MAG: hypothetical protein FWD31_04815 [Planctomycetaceae bacterium]|nr:hypothetical protein [Planctomycetaceae bacterium]